MIPYGVLAATRSLMNSPGTAPASQSTGVRAEAELLQVQVQRQNLLLQTLLMILLEKKVIHEDEFKEWMDYVDELDGVRDGRLRDDRSPMACPKCSRNSPRTATKCIYCGEDFPAEFLARRPAQE